MVHAESVAKIRKDCPYSCPWWVGGAADLPHLPQITCQSWCPLGHSSSSYPSSWSMVVIANINSNIINHSRSSVSSSLCFVFSIIFLIINHHFQDHLFVIITIVVIIFTIIIAICLLIGLNIFPHTQHHSYRSSLSCSAGQSPKGGFPPFLISPPQVFCTQGFVCHD